MYMASSGTEIERDPNLCGIELQWVDSSCPCRNHGGAKRPIFHVLHKVLMTIERMTHGCDKPIKPSHRKGNLKSHSFSLSVLRQSPRLPTSSHNCRNDYIFWMKVYQSPCTTAFSRHPVFLIFFGKFWWNVMLFPLSVCFYCHEITVLLS